ncbi:PREDICTED: nicotinamide riboside kinase 2 isoform X4 [Chinchilla lanigera]|uniref:nicotinamide riboside kinase 2 isoform X4 n=1 Tax=Chinchilla lanigera TaxID=34839 RepID=UPI00038EC717|nr:PREDICTED: nicotinamide riboside kinase 2 isoform X4 [Chinchilla lanigera]
MKPGQPGSRLQPSALSPPPSADMKIVVGIGGVTNGGKTTLTNSLRKALPNCCVIHQDDFFKPQDQIAVGEDGFKQWDSKDNSHACRSLSPMVPGSWSSANSHCPPAAVLESLDMEAMLGTVQAWLSSPRKFARTHGVHLQPGTPDTHILLLEGFLLYSYRPLLDLYSRRYFLTLPYEECKWRRSTRSYPVPDPPGLFDGHVWPMYQKYKREMEADGVEVEVNRYLTGVSHLLPPTETEPEPETPESKTENRAGPPAPGARG